MSFIDWFMGREPQGASKIGRQPTPYEVQLEAERKRQAALERAQKFEGFGQGIQAVGSAVLWTGIAILVIGLILVPLLLS